MPSCASQRLSLPLSQGPGIARTSTLRSSQCRLQVDQTCKRVIRSLRTLTFKPGKAEPMDDDNSHMAIAITRGLKPWKVASSETFTVW